MRYITAGAYRLRLQLYYGSIKDYETSLYMSIETLMGGHVLLHYIIHGSCYHPRIPVHSDFFKGDAQELVEVFVMIILDAYLKSAVRKDVFAVELELLK